LFISIPPTKEIPMFTPDDLIHRYTRKQAIEDGVLVDVTLTAREAGFRFPVALTRAAWERCITIPTGVTGQDEAGRLWDVLWMLHVAIKRGSSSPLIHFALHVRDSNRECTPPLVQLKALCGPGDDAEPVITIMLQEQD
jgi:hypothetical protein